MSKWSKTELQQLLGLAGDLPWPQVIERYSRWAAAAGYPARTSTAMRCACHRNRTPTGAAGEWIGAATVRQLLGIGDYQVRRWIRDGLVLHQRSGRRVFLCTRSLSKLARRHPAAFAGRPKLALLAVLDNERLAIKLSAMPRPVITVTPVTCIETGQRFESAAAAARWACVSRSAVHLAVAGRRPSAGGWRFRYAA
jgi:hypothetical protein